jgi:regulatory protein
MLGRRDLTRAEIRMRLLERGHDQEAVETALERLADGQLLDDRRTALAHVRTASRVKGRGRLRIQRELEARGISKALAREALDQISPDDDAALIARFVARKAGRAGSDTPAGRRRLLQQLLRRGFSAETISKALKDG